MRKELSKKYRLLQTLRILSQIVFFSLFLYLFLGTHFTGKDYIGRVEIFFHFDPLLALATYIASRTMFIFFLFASITIIFTFVSGRVVCGWLCPLGSVHQFFSFIFKKSKLHKPKLIQDKRLAWKYYLLVFILVSCLFTLDLVGFFDPLSLLFRSLATAIVPALNYSYSAFISLLYRINLSSLGNTLAQFGENLTINTIFHQGLFVGMIFIGIILLNLSRERFWCRYICPLGAFLALTARWNVIKLRIDMDKCIDCNLCNIQCQTLASPYPEEKWKSQECVYCFTCSAICPTAAISFPLGIKTERLESISFSRRKFVFTSLLGILVVPFFRISPSNNRASPRLIRAPGALPEEKFLRKCVKCGECMKACPTNGLQPAFAEAGLEGIWTPVLVPRIGYCEYYCSLCSQVCPTGAIKELSVQEKLKVKIGLAWVDKNRCIPYALGTPCIVCEEHCPTSPKAIKFVKTEVKLPDGSIKTPSAPVVDLDLCIGCGICEYKCPVVDKPAIYITSVGESRSEKNQLLLPLKKIET
ncbi:MAG: 4Fe-4S binding protein [Candidatus Aminicenantales bacterium]